MSKNKNYFEFINSVKILAGTDALEHIPHEFAYLNCKNPMLLTDEGLLKFGVVDKVKKALGAFKISTTYSKIPPDSGLDTVTEIARIYRERKCDGILAIGGGSVIDTAKGVRLMISQNCFDLLKLTGYERIPKGRHVPFVVAPSTSGTGSECTAVAVIRNDDKAVKMEFISQELLPDAAVLDARLTLTLPPRITANTGLDALCHAIEAYTCIQKNPLSDAYAITAIRLIKDNLLIALEDGKNDTARLNLSIASNLAGIAFSNSMVGLVHAIGHACGGVAKVPHGNAMTILMPYVFEFNLTKTGVDMSELIPYLADVNVYAGTPSQERGSKFIAVLDKFIASVCELGGLPTSLSEAGVTEEQLDEIAEKAINDGASIVNPISATRADIKNILKRAMKGRD